MTVMVAWVLPDSPLRVLSALLCFSLSRFFSSGCVVRAGSQITDPFKSVSDWFSLAMDLSDWPCFSCRLFFSLSVVIYDMTLWASKWNVSSLMSCWSGWKGKVYNGITSLHPCHNTPTNPPTFFSLSHTLSCHLQSSLTMMKNLTAECAGS